MIVKSQLKLSSMTPKPPIGLRATMLHAPCLIPTILKAVPATLNSTRKVLHARMTARPLWRKGKKSLRRRMRLLKYPTQCLAGRKCNFNPTVKGVTTKLTVFQPAPGKKAQDLLACFYMTFRSADPVRYLTDLQGEKSSFCTPASGEWGSCCGSPKTWTQLYYLLIYSMQILRDLVGTQSCSGAASSLCQQ